MPQAPEVFKDWRKKSCSSSVCQQHQDDSSAGQSPAVLDAVDKTAPVSGDKRVLCGVSRWWDQFEE